jgi:hypothetical protein
MKLFSIKIHQIFLMKNQLEIFLLLTNKLLTEVAVEASEKSNKKLHQKKNSIRENERMVRTGKNDESLNFCSLNLSNFAVGKIKVFSSFFSYIILKMTHSTFKRGLSQITLS